MGVFDKDIIEKSTINADTIASLVKIGDNFGQYNGGWRVFAHHNYDLDKITHKDIDEVLSNILSYIYYYALLGIDYMNINKHIAKIPTLIFGIDNKIFDNFNQYQWILEYVIDKLQGLGFEVTYCFNDDMLSISWNKKIAELHNTGNNIYNLYEYN